MVDYSVRNYNPYNMYQSYGYYNPAFFGTYSQQYQNVPLYDFNTMNYGYNYQPDTVSFSANSQIQPEQKQQGLSTGAKVAIGATVITALAIGADFIFCKGKHVRNLLGKLKGNKVKPEVKSEVKPQVNDITSNATTEIKPEKPNKPLSSVEESIIKPNTVTKAVGEKAEILSKLETENPVEVKKAMAELRTKPYNAESNRVIMNLNDAEYSSVSIELKEDGSQVVTYLGGTESDEYLYDPIRLIRKTYDRLGKEERVLIIRPIKDSTVDKEIIESFNGSPLRHIGITENTEFGKRIEREFASISGTKTIYKIIPSANGSSFTYKIIDKDGKVLLDESRLFEKIDNNHTRTTLKDFVYETEYIEDRIIVKKLNHDGTLVDTKTLDLGGNGKYLFDHYFIVPEDIVGKHTLDKSLSDLYKKVQGDALYTIADKGIRVRYGEPTQQSACYRDYLNAIYLGYGNKDNSYCLLHELGHAVDYTNGKAFQDNPKLKEILHKTHETYKGKTSSNDNRLYLNYILLDEEAAAEVYPILSGCIPESDAHSLRSILFQMEFSDYIAEYKNIIKNISTCSL